MGYSQYQASCDFFPYTNETVVGYTSESRSGTIVNFNTESGATAVFNAGLYSNSGSASTTNRVYNSTTSQTASGAQFTSYTFGCSGSTASYSYTESSRALDGGGFNIYEIGFATIATNTTIISAGRSITQNGTSTNSVTVYFPSLNHIMLLSTTTTSITVNLRVTATTSDTLYNSIASSTVSYVAITTSYSSRSLNNIKTTCKQGAVFVGTGERTDKFVIEWFGYSGGGAQNLALAYTTTGVNKDMSEYATVLMETDSFMSSKELSVISAGPSFSDTVTEETYTVTYDTILSSSAASSTTILQRFPYSIINSFSYGFIKTTSFNTTVGMAVKSSQLMELTSSSKDDVALYNTTRDVSGYSLSRVQTISTTSQFTQFVELAVRNIATSFAVRKLITTTAPFIERDNATAVDAASLTFSFAPAFVETALVIRTEEATNPDTFYTERASFASFAEPDYTSAYNGYSPADCSLVFLALVPLNSSASSERYPSWISVYNGTFSGIDRASTSNQSVTISQSSSYAGAGATDVYQTITYFAGNNANSQTTRTKSIPMVLVSPAISASRLVRTVAENLTSAYSTINENDDTIVNSYLPSIPVYGENVFFSQGLQADAGYSINRLLINAYITNQSTFAAGGMSSFPVSVSEMPYPIYRNKIRIDRAYEGIDFNSFTVQLLRYPVL